MVDLLKKTLYVSLGIITMTKERVEEVAKKVASEAKLSESEGKQFIDEVLKRSDEIKESIDKIVNEKTTVFLKTMNIPTRSEMNALELRIKKLELNNSQDK
ncbi:MAG TPA: phasin family protein [Chitinispirillaceae bacterium]|nr:phasin family protein [Chitinispirillaceae bacterium]